MRQLKFQLADAMKLCTCLRWLASSVVLCALALTLGQAHAEPAASIEPREVRDWLMRVHNAAHQRNFQGTFVISAAGVVSSARIAHFFEGGEQFEWIEPLDGQTRHVLRHNSEVHTVWPLSRVALVEQRDVVTSFPSLLLGVDDRITEWYDAQVQAPERAAGRDANVLLLKPRDEFRYGHRLWSDRQTGLLLRADVLNERGEVLEISAFTDVLIGVRSRPESVLQPMRTPAGYRVIKLQMQPTQLETEGWEMRKIVAGFKPLNCFRRPLGAAMSSDAKSSVTTAVHAVFSDGITYVSVFIEPYDEDRHLRPMLASEGATQTLMSRRGDFWLTVVGDVPAVTLRAFTLALERKK